MATAMQHPSYTPEDRYGTRNCAPLPVMLERGEGVWLFGTDGRRYLDMMSTYSAVSFEHSHPKLVTALAKQAGRLTLTSRAFHSTELGPFLADACRITRMDCAPPMSTGAEAVEAAIKAARRWARDVEGPSPEAAEIIVFDNNFHGRTTTIVGFSSHDQYRYGFGPFATGFRRIPFDDADVLHAAIGPSTGAILMRLVQGEGGIVEPPTGYLKLAHELTTQHNVLLVCDEVQTGLGHTGDVLASWREGVDADLVVLGRALSGGMIPVSIIAGREAVIGVFHPGDHGSTFDGNPLVAHIERAALILLTEEQLPQRATRVGTTFINELETLVGHDVRQVCGRGLMIGLQLDANIGAHDFAFALAEYGMLTRDIYGNVVRLAPSLVIGEAKLALALDAIRQTLAGWPRRKVTWGRTRKGSDVTIIDLIGAAIDCRTRDDGYKDGPHALLEAGTLGRSQTRDTHAAPVHDIELTMSAGHSHSARLATPPGVAGFSRAFSDATAYSVHQGHVPVVIGGGHSCVIGTWSGVASALRPRGPLGLIWIDAHFDGHVPQMGDSGAIHGIPLAALLSHGATALTQIRDAAPKLLPEHVVVIGARNYEPAERALLDLLGVRVIDATEVARDDLRAVMADAICQIESDTVAFGATLDLDAFDPVVAPGVGTPETDGFTTQGMARALVACARDARFAVFELVEYNPRHDKGGVTAHLALDLLVNVTGALRTQHREYTTAA